MLPLDTVIRRSDWFLRRRDLLLLGYTDAAIRAALADHRIFRVRQGWFSVPDAPEAAVRAVRVGGRLTSISALESYGVPVPRRPGIHIAVKSTAARLRKSVDRRQRLDGEDGVHIHWVDRARLTHSRWRVSIDDALLQVLTDEPRDVAVACASLVMHRQKWTAQRMDAVFSRAPKGARAWRALVSGLDEAHGETFFRLWTGDAGIPSVQQVTVAGVGRIDFQVGPHTFVEIDGGQHDPDWTDTASNSWEADHDRDASMAITGDRVLRFTYRQLYRDFDRVILAVRRSIADDLALAAARRRRPYRVVVHRTGVRGIRSFSMSRSHAQRKRRRFATKP
jgi:very-short-patch-repair endonuclease